MRNLIRRYRELSFEQKTVWNTIVGLCFSAVLACGKLLVGLFSDYNLISIAVYTLALLLAKLECVLGARTDRMAFRKRNALTAAFLFFSSVVYIGFMGRMLFIDREIKDRGMTYVLILAFISFCELGFAIAGLIRTRNKGHYYRNIKIINFCIALIAILTTQTAILNMELKTGVADAFNAYTGIGVGCFIALCAVYISIVPKTSVVGREHNTFLLKDAERNSCIDMQRAETELLLCRSRVYGDYIYRAKISENTVEGDIGRGATLWKRMHVVWKILCCILSEILIFVYLIGRVVLFFRSIDLPARLERKMNENGFVKIDVPSESVGP